VCLTLTSDSEQKKRCDYKPQEESSLKLRKCLGRHCNAKLGTLCSAGKDWPVLLFSTAL
jgi:hypothetical protein